MSAGEGSYFSCPYFVLFLSYLLCLLTFVFVCRTRSQLLRRTRSSKKKKQQAKQNKPRKRRKVKKLLVCVPRKSAPVLTFSPRKETDAAAKTPGGIPTCLGRGEIGVFIRVLILAFLQVRTRPETPPPRPRHRTVCMYLKLMFR